MLVGTTKNKIKSAIVADRISLLSSFERFWLEMNWICIGRYLRSQNIYAVKNRLMSRLLLHWHSFIDYRNRRKINNLIEYRFFRDTGRDSSGAMPFPLVLSLIVGTLKWNWTIQTCSNSYSKLKPSTFRRSKNIISLELRVPSRRKINVAFAKEKE